MPRRPKKPTTCSGPSCSRSVYALGLCEPHWTQQNRGNPLAPLREGPGRKVVSVRVSAEAAERVASDREGARTALERWARR